MRFRSLALALAIASLASACKDSTAPTTQPKTVSLVTAEVILDTASVELFNQVDVFFGVHTDTMFKSNPGIVVTGNRTTQLDTHWNRVGTFIITGDEKVSLLLLAYDGIWTNSGTPPLSFRAISDWKSVAPDSQAGMRVNPRSLFTFQTLGYNYLGGIWKTDSSVMGQSRFERTGDNTTAEVIVNNITDHQVYMESQILQERTFSCVGNSQMTMASRNGFVIAINNRISRRYWIPAVRITCETYSDMATANMALAMRTAR